MPTIYRSSDPGAPPMDGCPGSLVNILDGCLVHGYGALAVGTLTSNNTNVTAGDTVTIGSITYTFRASVTVVNDVQIGANADATLLNLINAINLTGTAGTTYISGQTGHPEVYAASVVTAHSFLVTSKRPGTLGNAVSTPAPSVGSTLSWGAATLAGGSVSKASLGWTKDYSALGRGIYRAPVASGGSRCYQEIIDNTPNPGTGLSATAITQGLEAVTALGGGVALSSGSGQFGHTIQLAMVKSQVANWIQRPWILIGDDRTYYLFIQNNVISQNYFVYGFGDIRSLVSGDTAKGFIFAGNGIAAPSSSYSAEYGGSNTATPGGHYLQRNWSGVIQNPPFGKSGDGGWRGNSSYFTGAMTLPHAPDGGLYLSPVYVVEGSAGAFTQRGLMRGIYHLLHPYANFNDGDTFAGVGDLAGRTFLIVKSTTAATSSPTGAYVVETTAWAS